jgi:hypothetical protein
MSLRWSTAVMSRAGGEGPLEQRDGLHPADPEVGDLDRRQVLGDEDVARVEVAVGDPLLVRGVEAAADPPEHLQRLRQRQPALAEHGVERGAGHVLHDEEEQVAVLVLVDDVDDVGVVEHRHRLRLAVEALDPLRVLAHLGRQHLDGDDAVERGLDGLEDLPHGALADAPDDFVLTDAARIVFSHSRARLRR